MLLNHHVKQCYLKLFWFMNGKLWAFFQGEYKLQLLSKNKRLSKPRYSESSTFIITFDWFKTDIYEGRSY